MATTLADQSLPGDALVHRWTLGDADTGEAKRIGAYADKSFAVWGTWDSATVVIQGSWDNPDGTPADASFITLSDSTNNAISVTSDDIGVISEDPVWIRPVSSGGLGSANLVLVISAPWRRNM